MRIEVPRKFEGLRSTVRSPGHSNKEKSPSIGSSSASDHRSVDKHAAGMEAVESDSPIIFPSVQGNISTFQSIVQLSAAGHLFRDADVCNFTAPAL
ncbi:hypothetical protein LINPERHAP1_LOCUS16983, partial [Linum perenne]